MTGTGTDHDGPLGLGVTVSFFAAVLLFVSAPALGSDAVLFLRDHSFYFHRMLHEVTEAYAAGRLPLWTDASGGGEPLAAYPGAMAFSPLLFLFALPGDMLTLYDLFVVAHFVVAGASAYFLARTVGCSRPAGVLIGGLFAFSGPVVSSNDLLPTFASVATAPLALGAAIRLAESPSRTRLAVCGLALGWHVSTSEPVHLFYLSVIFAVFIAATARALGARRVGRRLPWLIGAAVLGFCVSAIQILPLLELMIDAPRGAGFAYDRIAQFSVTPARLFNLILPGWSGSLDPQEILFTGPSAGHYLHSIYLGASALPLFCAGLALKRARGLIVSAALFVVLALGSHFPLHALVVSAVPGLDSSRFPVKLVFAVGVIFVLVVALVLAEIERGDDLQRRRMTIAGVFSTSIVALICMSVSLVDVAWLADSLDAPLERARPHLMASASAGLGLLLFGLLAFGAIVTKRVSGLRALGLLAILFAVDVGWNARGLLLTTDRALFEPQPALALIERAQPTLWLQDPLRSGAPRPGEGPKAIYAYGASRLLLGFSGLHGVRQIFDRDLNANRGHRWQQMEETFRAVGPSERVVMAKNLGIRHFATESSTVGVAGIALLGRAPTAHEQAPISIWRIEGARPLVWAATKVQIVEDDEAAMRALSGLNDAAVMTRDAWNQLDSDARTTLTSSTVSSLEGTRHSPGALGCTVTSQSGALLVFGQVAERGWVVRVDGQPARLHRVQGMYLGVWVPKGTHEIRVDYAPSSVTAGIVLSVFALLVALGLVILDRRAAPTAAT